MSLITRGFGTGGIVSQGFGTLTRVLLAVSYRIDAIEEVLNILRIACRSKATRIQLGDKVDTYQDTLDALTSKAKNLKVRINNLLLYSQM